MDDNIMKLVWAVNDLVLFVLALHVSGFGLGTVVTDNLMILGAIGAIGAGMSRYYHYMDD